MSGMNSSGGCDSSRGHFPRPPTARLLAGRRLQSAAWPAGSRSTSQTAMRACCTSCLAEGVTQGVTVHGCTRWMRPTPPRGPCTTWPSRSSRPICRRRLRRRSLRRRAPRRAAAPRPPVSPRCPRPCCAATQQCHAAAPPPPTLTHGSASGIAAPTRPWTRPLQTTLPLLSLPPPPRQLLPVRPHPQQRRETPRRSPSDSAVLRCVSSPQLRPSLRRPPRPRPQRHGC
eukprot:364398-Chlamydomonas_euryale.AAC.11